MPYIFDSFPSNTIPSSLLSSITDKKLSSRIQLRYMMTRLQTMFTYSNLPSTIPAEILEYYLLTNGSCLITKVSGNLYVFVGGFGGEPDVYYRPTIYTVANPALNYSASIPISYTTNGTALVTNQQLNELTGEPTITTGILCRNDTQWFGVLPLAAQYASLLSENLLTIRTADILLRIVALLTAPDERTKAAAELYLKKIEKGDLGVIGENRFFDGIKMQSPPSNNGSYLTQFIELHQYLRASFFNEIGLNANFNMKRESITKGESRLNEDSLLPLIENMLMCRQQDMDAVNRLYGTEITVDFNSAWKLNVQEMYNDLRMQEAEIEATEVTSQPDSNEQSDSPDEDSTLNTESSSDPDDSIQTEDSDNE